MYEQPNLNPAELAVDTYCRGGEKALFDIDGEFVFIEVGSDSRITIRQCNYSMQDIYYRKYDGKYKTITRTSEWKTITLFYR